MRDVAEFYFAFMLAIGMTPVDTPQELYRIVDWGTRFMLILSDCFENPFAQKLMKSFNAVVENVDKRYFADIEKNIFNIE